MTNIEQIKDTKIKKQLFSPAFKKNWVLFKQSTMGRIGLFIILFFAFLALVQPLFFISGYWSQNVYNPVVGYDSIKVNLLIVKCPKNAEFPTEKYEKPKDCPGKGEISDRMVMPFVPTAKLGDNYETFLQPAPPSREHWLGTDSLGRDVFSQIMEGSQVAFMLGLMSATLSVGIATFLGTIAAFWGGRVDAYIMRQSDLILMLPQLPLLLIMAALYRFKVWHLALVLGILGGFGGLVISVKSQALQVKVKPFVDSARVTGGTKFQIMTSHILPNVAPIALLFMVFGVTGAIFAESTLSYLGLLNIDMSWGMMIYLAQADGFIFSGLRYWWLVLPAGLSVTFLSGGFYLVGRGLDDVFNPRLRRR